MGYDVKYDLMRDDEIQYAMWCDTSRIVHSLHNLPVLAFTYNHLCFRTVIVVGTVFPFISSRNWIVMKAVLVLNRHHWREYRRNVFLFCMFILRNNSRFLLVECLSLSNFQSVLSCLFYLACVFVSLSMHVMAHKILTLIIFRSKPAALLHLECYLLFLPLDLPPLSLSFLPSSFSVSFWVSFLFLTTICQSCSWPISRRTSRPEAYHLLSVHWTPCCAPWTKGMQL